MKVWKLGFVICVCFLFVCGGSNCSSKFMKKNQYLKVSSPEYLKATYECAIGNLGIPQHGGTLTGVVVYPQVNQKACKSFIDYQLSFKTKTLGSLPVLLLVDRGDCYLMLKAWNAQNAGAAGIIVADDRLEPWSNSYLPEEIGYDYLENITIPSVLVSSSIGVSMKKALYKGDFVRVNLEWTEAYEFEKNSDDKCDDEIEELRVVNRMWRFIIEPTPILWGFLMENIWSWSTSLWTNGYNY